jgi:hypothetical protein
VRDYIERAGYVYQREDRAPLGIPLSVFKSDCGPMYMTISCHHRTPPDSFAFCLNFRLQPGVGDWVKGMFNKTMPIVRMAPENELHRIVTELKNAGVTARAWNVITEAEDVRA